MPSLLIADDHPLTLIGTRTFVESLGYTVIDVCNNGIAAYNGIITRQPDIALLDMSMPGMNGIEILEKLQKHKITTQLVLLTMHNEVSLFNKACELGARGYLLKEFAAKELETCLREVLNHKTWFSPQLSALLVADDPKSGIEGMNKLTFSEKKILELIGRQYKTRAIAEMLFISEKTVENHRSNIMKKLNIPPEKNGLLIWAMKNLTE